MNTDEASITKYIADTFDGVDVVVGSREAGSPEIAWGDTFFIYDPDRNLEPRHQFPFATIVTKDYGEFDRASNLDRPGVFRLNVGVSKQTFQSLFPSGDAGHDFTALDQTMPHPVYGKMHWVCVLNPSETTFEAVKPLLAVAYGTAVARHGKRES
jgi:hypothetical protein